MGNNGHANETIHVPFSNSQEQKRGVTVLDLRRWWANNRKKMTEKNIHKPTSHLVFWVFKQRHAEGTGSFWQIKYILTTIWFMLRKRCLFPSEPSDVAFGKPDCCRWQPSLTRRASCWNLAAFLVSATARSTKPTDWSMLLSILSIIPPLQGQHQRQQK